MKTVFDMMSGDRDVALSDPIPETELVKTCQQLPPELALRLLTVEEAVSSERRCRQPIMY